METILTIGDKRLVFAGESEIAWASERLGNVAWPADTCGLAIYQGERLAAVTLYNVFMGASCSAHIVTDGRRDWANRGMLRGIFAFPFDHLDRRRITLPIAERNVPAQVLALKLGFRFEGRLLNSLEDDNEVIFGMLRENCIWIGRT